MVLNFQIAYKKEVENKVVDALSRRTYFSSNKADMQLNVLASSSMVPNWCTRVTKGYDTNELS